MSFQHRQLACQIFSTVSCSIVFYVRGSTAGLYHCPLFFPAMHEAHKIIVCIPVHYREIVLYIDPIT